MRIRVIDVETSGIDPAQHAICELGFCDVLSTTETEGKPGGWEVGLPSATLVQPCRPIPAEASAIHHITDEDVIDAPQLRELVPTVLQYEGIDAFAAHYANFERGFLGAEVTLGKPWICTYKCALRLWKDEPGHGNQALRYSRRPEGLDRDLATPSHRAGPDAYVTAHLLRDMLNDGALLEHLIKRSSQPALQVTCQIGYWRGKKWSEVDVGMLNWILKNEFDEDVKYTANHWILEDRARKGGLRV